MPPAESSETEQHFLLDCRQLSDQRTKLFDDIDQIVNGSVKVSAAASSSDVARFSTASLPVNERMMLLGGGSHPHVGENIIYHDVHHPHRHRRTHRATKSSPQAR